MSELIDRQALLDECLNHYEVGNIEQNCTMDWICKTVRNVPTVSPWHRVEEELPEQHRDVLVSGMEAINNSRVYKVMVNDNGTWRPTDYAPSIRWDYWMPIEPPKE